MRLVNFELATPWNAIELCGCGHQWDLHNIADFVGLRFDAPSCSATLRWEASSSAVNPWGDRTNTYAAVELRFTGVREFYVTSPEVGRERDGDTCVESIARVDPGALEAGERVSWGVAEPFDLRIDFTSGRKLLVSAEAAELLPLRKPANPPLQQTNAPTIIN